VANDSVESHVEHCWVDASRPLSERACPVGRWWLAWGGAAHPRFERDGMHDHAWVGGQRQEPRGKHAIAPPAQGSLCTRRVEVSLSVGSLHLPTTSLAPAREPRPRCESDEPPSPQSRRCCAKRRQLPHGLQPSRGVFRRAPHASEQAPRWHCVAVALPGCARPPPPPPVHPVAPLARRHALRVRRARRAARPQAAVPPADDARVPAALVAPPCRNPASVHRHVHVRSGPRPPPKQL